MGSKIVRAKIAEKYIFKMIQISLMPRKRNIILNRSQGESKDHNDELDALDCSSWLLAVCWPDTLPQFESKVQIAF